MLISADSEFKRALTDAIAQREFHERTGIHCSDLVYCLNKACLRKLGLGQDTEQDILTYSIGWATQRWLTGSHKDEDEIEVDGIKVTCDANAVNILPNLGRGLIPWELKATYQSSTKEINENVNWLRQIMAQCYVTGSNVAYLSRFELLGNWKSIFPRKGEDKNDPANSKPTLSCWRLEFSDAELNHNWQWLLKRKKLLTDLLDSYPKAKQLLPKAVALPQRQDYECGRCHFRGKECQLEQ